MFTNEIKKEIDNSSVVSFDIFDTLLYRPYVSPKDLFLHIDKLYGVNFSKERIKAEKLAWKKIYKNKMQEDITFNDIYSFMPSNLKDFQNKEAELEKNILKTNPEIYKILDYARNLNKKIIIASDMYLPQKIIEEILDKNNIYFDKLYLSNVYLKRKDSGNLYKYISKDLNVSYDKIFHIGDNLQSDYLIPKELGIKAFHYPNIVQTFFSKNVSYRNFYKKNPSLSISFMLATMAFGLHFFMNENSTYWNKIGFLTGGPLCYAFLSNIAKFIHKENIKSILFAARDGYGLKKIYDTCFKNQEDTQYFYAPRLVKEIFDEDYDNLRKISSQDKIDFIKEEYKKYINSLNITSSSCLVDSVTSSFSAQSLVQNITKMNPKGYYIAALKDNHSFSYETFLKSKCKLQYGNFIEILLSAPEKPILWIANQKPHYEDKIDDFEQITIKIYPEILEGEVKFCNYVNSILKPNEILFDDKDIDALFSHFANNPSGKDIKEMSVIKNGVDSVNSAYVSIFPKWYYKKIKFLNIPFVVIKEDYKYKVIKILGLDIFKVKKDKTLKTVKKGGN